MCFFQRVWGVYKIVVEILKGWGGVILVVKKWKFRGGGGGLCEIPSMVGVWIFSGTIQCDGKTTITITFPYPDTM